MEIVNTAAALSTYGLYAVVAILLFAVLYLYKEHDKLVDDIKKTMLNDSKELAKLLAESNEVIRRNTQVMENMEVISGKMSEMTTQIRILLENHRCGL